MASWLFAKSHGSNDSGFVDGPSHSGYAVNEEHLSVHVDQEQEQTSFDGSVQDRTLSPECQAVDEEPPSSHCDTSDLAPSSSDRSTSRSSQTSHSLQHRLSVLEKRLGRLVLAIGDLLQESDEVLNGTNTEDESVPGRPSSAELIFDSRAQGQLDQTPTTTRLVLPERNTCVQQTAAAASQTPSAKPGSKGGQEGNKSGPRNSKRALLDRHPWDLPDEDDGTSKRPRRTPDSNTPGDDPPGEKHSPKIPCFVTDCPGKDAHISELACVSQVLVQFFA